MDPARNSRLVTQKSRGTEVEYAVLAGIAADSRPTMTLSQSTASDQKAVSIFAKSIYRELRASGYSGEDVMQLAGELLSLLTRDVKSEVCRPVDWSTGAPYPSELLGGWR